MLTRSSTVKPRGAAIAPVVAMMAVPSISKRNFIQSSVRKYASNLHSWARLAACNPAIYHVEPSV
jgi:hypothetical protein